MSVLDDVFVGILWVSLLVQVPVEVVSRQDKDMIVRIVECKPLEGSSKKKDVAWKKDAESQVMNVGVSARCQEMCSQSGRGMKRWGIEELHGVSCPAAGLGECRLKMCVSWCGCYPAFQDDCQHDNMQTHTH